MYIFQKSAKDIFWCQISSKGAECLKFVPKNANMSQRTAKSIYCKVLGHKQASILVISLRSLCTI